MTGDYSGCPICKEPLVLIQGPGARDVYQCNCPQCGEFTLSYEAKINLRHTDPHELWKISAWVVQNNPQVVTTNDVERAVASVRPSLYVRAERMLRFLATCLTPGKTFALPALSTLSNKYDAYLRYSDARGEVCYLRRLMAVGWNQSPDETLFMLTEVLCNEMGLLVSQNNHDYQVSPKGLLYLEGRREGSSSVGFCAMWFSPEIEVLWADVICRAIKDAGYEPVRIDKKDHNEKIDDAIVAEIRAAHFVVADFTGNRGGVYYEAGFAHGLGLPVIFMCRDGDALHLDVRQYNCIFWKPDELAEARERLKNRILATLGQGPKALK